MNVRPLAAALLLAAAVLGPPAAPAAAQDDPSGRPLTVTQVKNELEARLARNPSYATIWNAGYDLYRLHLRNQDTALIILRGYLAVRGQTAEENLALRQAAIYWEKVHDYGVINVPVGQDFELRGQIYRGSEATAAAALAMRRPKGGPVPLRPGDRRVFRGVGRRGAPGAPQVKSRYPGPYYPGVYPP
ncbi:MAG: hypothetical protein LBU12_08815 [Deltaproteobacteria bacterium]|nr:hypothetical protein [Deltaproteobacteria bacterium]